MKEITFDSYLLGLSDYHFQKYDYELASFQTDKKEIIVDIFCKEHMTFFSQNRYKHFKKSNGCPVCKRNAKIKFASEKGNSSLPFFFNQLSEKHFELFDYTQTKINQTRNYMIDNILCKKHGELFSQNRQLHRKMISGCSSCKHEEKIAGSSHLRTTLKTYLQTLDDYHKDNFCYDMADFDTQDTKVLTNIFCKKHKEFFSQNRYSHAKKFCGCPKCKREKIENKMPSGTPLEKRKEKFLAKAKNVWGDRWDYSNLVYTTMASKMEFKCPKHGVFEQTGNYHVAGHVGCNACLNKREFIYEKDKEAFIKRSKEVWGENRWDYSNLQILKAHGKTPSKVVLRCISHDCEFTQNKGNHLAKSLSCTYCKKERAKADYYKGRLMLKLKK